MVKKDELMISFISEEKLHFILLWTWCVFFRWRLINDRSDLLTFNVWKIYWSWFELQTRKNRLKVQIRYPVKYVCRYSMDIYIQFSHFNQKRLLNNYNFSTIEVEVKLRVCRILIWSKQVKSWGTKFIQRKKMNK